MDVIEAIELLRRGADLSVSPTQVADAPPETKSMYLRPRASVR